MESMDIEDLRPEHKLLIAIVERSYRDLSLPISCCLSPYEKIESKRFFDSRSMKPFSYRWICQHLEVDPDWLFKRLKNLHTSPSGHLKDKPN